MARAGPAARTDLRPLSLQDCVCDDHCHLCSVVLTLSAKCMDNKTMEVTSKMLVVESQEGDGGKTRRSEVGKPAMGESTPSLTSGA